MTENRLSNLCLINAQIDTYNYKDNILDIFAKTKNRHLEFVI